MSPSSPLGRFGWRFLRTVTVALLLFYGWLFYSFSGISSQGSAGLAAVSAGVSELVVETGLLVLVALVVASIWSLIADRRSRS